MAAGSFYQPFGLPAEILDVLFQGLRRTFGHQQTGGIIFAIRGTNQNLLGQVLLMLLFRFRGLLLFQLDAVDLILDGFEFAALDRAVWDPLESTCRHASLSIL